DSGGHIEIQCADFRHGSQYVLQGTVCINAHEPSPFRIELSMTASNLPGEIENDFEIAYTIKNVSPTDLINSDGEGLTICPMIQLEIDRIAEAKDFTKMYQLTEKDIETLM